MTIELNEAMRRLVGGPNFAVLATLNPDGAVRLIGRLTPNRATGYAA